MGIKPGKEQIAECISQVTDSDHVFIESYKQLYGVDFNVYYNGQLLVEHMRGLYPEVINEQFRFTRTSPINTELRFLIFTKNVKSGIPIRDTTGLNLWIILEQKNPTESIFQVLCKEFRDVLLAASKMNSLKRF